MRQLLQSFQESHIILALSNEAVVIALDKDQCSVTRLPADVSEIQAVALTKILPDGPMLYAVARSNKSLQIFHETDLAVSHSTPKRVSSLWFTSVVNESNTMTVVVAGDLAGDAIAYPIEKDPKEEESKNKATKCRLLLGHTASMLTKVMVQNKWILTADRDEKIRVSYFPDTHRIHGYLLGHLAFVSSFDVCGNICASCGGDGMVRVWDLSTCTELASVSTARDDKDNEDPSTRFVPTSILWDESGHVFAVIYDESLHVDFFSWQDGTISRCARMQCQAQPLGMARLGSSHFLILIRDAPFVQEFLLDSTDKSRLTVTEPTTSAMRCKVEDTAKELAISDMPESLLERDPSGSITIEKHSETRGPTHTKPWEKVSRVEVAKERSRRFKRRKQESMTGDDENEDDEQE